MVRSVAMLLCLLSFVALQAHNFIGHEHHHEAQKQKPAHHHHEDGSAHTHHPDHKKASDNHNPDFGKYVVNKQETTFTIFTDGPAILYTGSLEIPATRVQNTPLYSISPHQSLVCKLIVTSLPFRGPPAIAML